jgi:hypothetical protein
MITATGELTYGSIYNNNFNGELYISEKFVGIKKIVSTPKYFYILVDDDIYYNTTLSDDNFKKTICTSEYIRFLDMDVSRDCLFALDVDSMLYKIIGILVTKIDHNFGTIVNIYGSYTNRLILKNETDDYYVWWNINDNLYDLLFLGKCDRIYFTTQGFVLIMNDNISVVNVRNGKLFLCLERDSSILTLLSTLHHNFYFLYQIPNGSFLKFYDGHHIMSSPRSTNDIILYNTAIKLYFVNICSITKNVYSNDYVNIPEFKNLCSSIKYNKSRNIKNANNIVHDQVYT